MRRPCFVEEEDAGLASIASTEVGYSGSHNNPFFTRSRKSTSYRSLTSLSSSSSSFSSSPRSTKFYDARCKEPHFLETCFLCKKHIGDNRDIFMYRGDTPFCSEECREEQIEMDEAKEKNSKFTSSMRNIRKDKQASSNNKNYQPRTNTVAAA